ncbi:MAG: 3-keto-5-aminohexanoate cleavage protein [Deltaproteobacteria bacterium]|nr:3-keto-5-aminohexanoate cleavage protein [Deltaproteobacteria bacterium]MBT4088792.1 3-keto-5-aminohexanoate cleavage protein [Deltaproteobacteria bacterium]MBT4266765.1 3-keto-5-aminohexanoate cleavage protein [Deltaproteobacteria bacterium]MBT4643729.1 3-keto-5-aminohexanoate cleavage protein [Deltaproteobacteria bacterium]MBT6503285.1 3-keto-5-aminohexanoate cleavage protein [Deltaproteobacteria bacterium]
MNNVIVSAAIIGASPTRAQSQYIPITPAEIADSALGAHKAGAAIVHIHVRNPETGEVSNELSLFAEVVERIRAKADVVLNLSTGGGGGMYISADGEVTSGLLSAEERVAHILELKPEICSLDIGTMNFGPGLFVNAESVVDKMAAMIKEIGSKPEIELFDLGHIEIAKRLIKLGLIEGTPHYQLCMGTAGSMAATPTNAVHFAECLPADSTWSIFGVGRTQFPMAAMGVLLGGHVRVGFEDNLYLDKGVKAESNAQLVERAVAIIGDLNKKVASVEETREILGLKKP